MPTIYALASGRGKAGLAVVRLSGPESHAAVMSISGPLPAMRQVGLRRLTWRGDVLDEALVLAFSAGASFTGEAVAEIHLHGGQAVVASVLRALADQPGLRMAEPGEFTRRALENGRLDLTQIEGLADLIDAETEAQRRQAMRVLSGAIGKRAESWRRDLIRAAALVEATIDFVDEDVPLDVRPEVRNLICNLLADLRRETEGARMAERVRDGFEVAIVGVPNAGKSTLLNAFAGREAAITSELAGTTRDVIEVRMDLRGFAVSFLDTAGLRETADPVELIGIERAVERATASDIRLFLLDDTGMPQGVDLQPGDIVVQGQSDRRVLAVAGVSGVTGEGVDELLARVADVLSSRSSGAATLTRERHRVAAVRAISALESAFYQIEDAETQSELLAEELRTASRALDALVGRVDVENLLDEIFASFCIGK